MSTGVNRIYINSYLAYKNDAGESLRYFQVDFPSTILDPKALYVKSLSVALTYTEPNISPTQNKLVFDLSGTTYTLLMPTSDRYIGANNPYGTPGSDFESTLNVLFQGETGISANPFVFDDNNLKFSFDLSSTGQAYVSFSSSSTFARRIGLGRSQLDTPWSVPVVKFDNSPIVARTQCLYLACSNTNDSMNNSEANYRGDIMCQIPLVSSAFGDLVEYVPPFAPQIANVGSFSSLVFQVLDDEFNPISFQSNTNLGMEMEVDYAENQNNATNVFKMPTFKRVM
jgi:hypothetical protein